MTDEEIVQEVRKAICDAILNAEVRYNRPECYVEAMEQILSIKNLAIVGEGGLPEVFTYGKMELRHTEVNVGWQKSVEQAQGDMLKANFRRVIDET